MDEENETTEEVDEESPSEETDGKSY